MLYRFIDIFNGAIVPIIAVLIIFGAVKRERGGKIALIVLLVAYLAAVFDIVGIPYAQVFTVNPTINWIPFSDLWKTQITPLSIFQFAANIVLFIPLGVFLPAIWKTFRKFRALVIAGALMSLCIELSQLLSSRVVDVDDLLMNTAGAIIGYWIIAALSKKAWQNNAAKDVSSAKRDIAELLAAAALVFFSTIFIKYPIAQFVYGLQLFG